MAKAHLTTGVIQDGAQFYREDDGILLASYPDLVANDGDLDGAIAARFVFVTENPEYGYIDRQA